MLTRAQITNLQQEVLTKIQEPWSKETKLLNMLQSNKINDRISSWNGNLQLGVPMDYQMTGSIQGHAYNDSNVYLQNAAQSAQTDKNTFNVAGVLHTFVYDKILQELNDAEAKSVLRRRIISQAETYRKLLNMVMYNGTNGLVVSKATNAAGGSDITIPAGVDSHLVYIGMAVEFNDSGQPGWNGSSGLNSGYYGIVTAITENAAAGTVTLTCKRYDLSTAAAFTVAHTEQPLYLLGTYAKLPYGLRDLWTKNNTIGSIDRSTYTRYNPLTVSADDVEAFRTDPFRYLYEMCLRINARGPYKVDTIWTDSLTASWLASKIKQSRSLVTEYKGEKLLGFSPNIALTREIGIIDDIDMPYGNIVLLPSKNLWIAPLSSDRPTPMDPEDEGLRLGGRFAGEIGLKWFYQFGLYVLQQIGAVTDCDKYWGT